MSVNKLRGMGVALVTPFTTDLKVDVAALKKLVQYNLNNGTDYLVVLGTTGETATLTQEEKELVIETVKSEALGKVPLVLGIGGNDTAQVVTQLKATDLSDFDAVLSVSPYYNKPSQEGIYQHYKAVAEASSKPILLYNVPGRTSSNISPDTVLRLSKVDNIIGIKEAAGDMEQVLRLLRVLPEDFLVISGDDMLALGLILAGGDGVISVIGQAMAKDFSDMVSLGLEGKHKEAYKLHYKTMPLIDSIFEEGNPVGIKSLLSELDICNNLPRLPLVPATQALSEKIKKQLKA